MAAPALETTTVTTENCVLHITYTGNGPKLLILVPGGTGLGSAFHASLPGLTVAAGTPGSSSSSSVSSYTVATFDRRGHGVSNLTPSGDKITTVFSPAQAARDVAAIIAHLGFERASVFGTSQGGVIALHFGVYFPDKLEKLVAHESPTFGLLPGLEGARWLDHITRTYSVFKTKGPGPAMKLFLRITRGWRSTSQDEVPEGEVLDPLVPATDDEVDGDHSDVPEDTDPAPPVGPDQLFWLEYEFLTAISVPNLWELRSHLHGDKYPHLSPNSLACVVGKASRDAPYAATTYPQAEITGSQHHVWPAGHLIYAVDPDAFVLALRDTLARLK
jgi:pimeloyl-ACP methyl ester carboxylesterase